ncbi:MAG: GCN5-related N-acetyltransferase [Betaproteobacteria bacterium]|nr:GCN5-related N-acetyltransferase [Betaproteobacteria bacterium]
MNVSPQLVAVSGAAEREAARGLILEYLRWIEATILPAHGLSVDIDAMVLSDIEDRAKFYPPYGRFYLLRHDGNHVGVGCLKRLSADAAELQRMYVQPAARGIGAGRLLLNQLVDDARALGHSRLRLESLKALAAAHAMYRSAGFVDIEPYADNSMQAYQAPRDLAAFRAITMYMELRL